MTQSSKRCPHCCTDVEVGSDVCPGCDRKMTWSTRRLSNLDFGIESAKWKSLRMTLPASAIAGYIALVAFTGIKWSRGPDRPLVLVVVCVLLPCLYGALSKRRSILGEITSAVCWVMICCLASVAFVIALIESCIRRNP